MISLLHTTYKNQIDEQDEGRLSHVFTIIECVEVSTSGLETDICEASKELCQGITDEYPGMIVFRSWSEF